MRSRFETIFHGYLFVLLAILFWALWADAQTNTNATASASSTTNAPAATTNTHRLTLDPQPIAFGLDKIEPLQVPLSGRPLWQYLAFLVYAVAAFLVAKLINLLVNAVLKRWVARTPTPVDDALLKLLAGPVKVVAFVILLHIGLRIFTWSDWVDALISKGLKLVVAGSLTYLALKCVDIIVDFRMARAKAAGDEHALDRNLVPLLRNTAKVFIIIVAILVTAQNLGVNTTSVLASLSIGGLAIGLAAQDTFANLFGAVAIYLDRPFGIGDRIIVDVHEGVVETIGLRSTRIRRDNGHLVSVPNKTMGNATITNVSERPNILTQMNLAVPYETSNEKLRRAIAILEEVYRGHPMTGDVIVAFNKFTDAALNIQILHWWKSTDSRAHMADMQELNFTVKQRLEAAGIEFAFPTQTLHLRTPGEPRAAAAT